MLSLAGLQVLAPIVKRLGRGEPGERLRMIGLVVVTPVLSCALFLVIWTIVARTVKTNYGSIPTPDEVWCEAKNLVADHFRSRGAERDFYAQQREKAERCAQEAKALKATLEWASPLARAEAVERAAKLEREAASTLARRYSAAPTFFDQVGTSLKTVFAGFLLASLLAVPLGVLCGVSKVFLAAVSPLIQVFKPVSPLAWLPIVMILVGALYTTKPEEAWFEKSFLSSAFTVALCSLWPTLVNTALGVASVDKDHWNVARVLKLGWFRRITKIIIPSALPLIFTGLRISLGVGWMVLVAADMLAQNPGLGKFVWDMFQNGSRQTMAQIMVAIFVIGVIGFVLDRVMVVLERSVSYG
jgi:nitrate/nitrite transport system permease protein